MSSTPVNFLHPKAFESDIHSGTLFGSTNLTTFASTAVFLQISNIGATWVAVRLNGDSGCTFNLHNGVTQIFSVGEGHFTSVDFQATASGQATTVQVIYALME